MTLGRPRAFDLDERLDRAMRVFWRQGYEGTGLADLTEAMGISRPSLYAAYGNKEALFRKAVAHYTAGPARHADAALAEPTARAVTEHLLRGTVRVCTSDENPSAGCLIVQGALVTGPQGAALREELALMRAEGERALCARYRRAQEEGDLPAGLDPADLARHVKAVTYGIAVQAATGTAPADLHRLVDMTLAAWPPPAPAPAPAPDGPELPAGR
ncbi:TetR/AcrR family transcriptional regulator [Streptomyces bambusae]|uniref:TetR/AcrR family transcriptional regulator n=1 Tax=Streptomyces bambusae TaxID=1550616 RepID=UPI001CFDED03|nr:TetR/AcrR family transcriptional regulator [Streptomyces bambusae]MCB5167058.1 TetR/AcrR family transcriptional regulator [Streptomyces bambusae]